MNTIELDMGVETFSFAGGGQLRFNPRDPNLYARFLEAEQELKSLEDDLTAKAKDLGDTPESAVRLTREADSKIKELLNRVFGGQNDFNEVLGGVSLLAVASNGKSVIANLLSALEEILARGAEVFAREMAEGLQGN